MRVEFERRVLRLFDAMLDQPPASRPGWLEDATGGDAALIAAVNALAAADRVSAALPTIPPEPTPPTPEEPPPPRIGNYRIVGELGRGGMGLVYLAERDDGLFDHRVAIKLIRRALFSDAARQQFDTERRILARLRHPHIAQLLDGGVADNGAPYIIMELIGGASITDHAGAAALALADRLTLFAEALGAIEHAHRNLIVHADIKPSNVVVEEGFGVKLLDFGIARLLDGGEGQRAGGYTPGYASPARIAGLPPTPADDVFAAGRLLRALTKDVAGGDDDLSAITDRATAEEPARRYGAISELADDLTRWRGNRPVTARPPNRARRAALYWRRNRLAVTLAAAAALLLLATATVTTLLWLRAERARASAEARFDETRSMANYMLSDVDPQLARLPGTLPLRRRLVSNSHRYLRTLERERAGSVPLDLEVASGYLRLAQVYGLDVSGGVGDLAAARDSLARARAILRPIAAHGPATPDLLALEARMRLIEGSGVFVAPGAATLDKALADLRAAQALYTRYLAARPGDVDARINLWRAQVMTGRVFMYRGDAPACRRIVAAHLASRLMPVRTPEQRADRDFIANGSYLMLAEATEADDPAGALGWYDLLAARVEAMRREGRSDLQNDFIQATAFAGKGEINLTLGNHPAAIADYRRALAALERLLDFGPNHALASFHAYVQLQLANSYARSGAPGPARALADRAVAWFRADLARQPGDGSAERMLALGLQLVSEADRRAGAPSACASARAAATQWDVVARRRAVLPIDLATDGPIRRVRAAVGNCAAGQRAG